MIWRHLLVEGLLFRASFQPEFFSTGLSSLFGRLFETYQYRPGPATGYRRDGSRVTQTTEIRDAQPPNKPLASRRQVLPGYLSYDLTRLKRLERYGTNVVVYESALSPNVADIFWPNPSHYALQSRNEYIRTCRDLDLDCRSAPKRLPGPELPWGSPDHAPPENLGALMDSLISIYVPDCAV